MVDKNKSRLMRLAQEGEGHGGCVYRIVWADKPHVICGQDRLFERSHPLEGTLAKGSLQAQRKMLEAWLVDRAIAVFNPELDTQGFLFRTKLAAGVSLIAARQALRRRIPWPAWAILAKAHGWKPPAGWTPKSAPPRLKK